eukprot:CAMPEP_0119328502 /NCGR_PEP_ID=MMETSP1333-20130426/73503_1 /TAXON_ID=418940 /ORGANISM="Scyphosphaera apsteinii, Strain RCC1455" /LENGTH=234 /DNA_ID=CAMNT_0007337375 /DNA_START=29 /DNA_END=733 /DNA_ORIENTATION=-
MKDSPMASVQYLLDGQNRFSRLPFTPTILDARTATATAVSISTVFSKDTLTGRESTWHIARAGTSSATPCARGLPIRSPSPLHPPPVPLTPPPSSPPVGKGKGRGKGDGSTDADDSRPAGDDSEIALFSGALCYQLRLEPLSSSLLTSPAVSFFELLDSWGGAYAFVFGVLGAALCAIEAVHQRVQSSRSDAAASHLPSNGGRERQRAASNGCVHVQIPSEARSLATGRVSDVV